MIKGLSGATIWSEDLNNLLPFYRDVLGLKVAHKAQGFAVLGDGNGPNLGLGTHRTRTVTWSASTLTTWMPSIIGSLTPA